jgi:probable DNA repair protein
MVALLLSCRLRFRMPKAPLYPELHATLDAGATVVTPNRRLARAIAADYDAAKAAHQPVWPSARVLPWSAWLQHSWQEARRNLALLSAEQDLVLWTRFVRRSDSVACATAPRPVARLAAQAQRLADEWDLPLMAAGGTGPLGDWAEEHAALCRRENWQSPSRLASAIAPHAQQPLAHGVLGPSPLQHRLLRVADLVAVPGNSSRYEFPDRLDEAEAIALWVEQRLRADPTARLGIVCGRGNAQAVIVGAAIDARLGSVEQFEERQLWDGYLGQALADAPVIAVALSLLALFTGPLPKARIASLLRSPYWAGGDAGGGLEIKLRRSEFTDVDRPELLAAARQGEHLQLAQCLDLPPPLRLVGRRDARAWADAFELCLRHVGWPGSRASSGEAQAIASFFQVFRSFAGLALVLPQLGASAAVAELTSLVRERDFQTERQAAAVTLVGLDECFGFRFDSLWVAGLGDDVLPRAPRAHALLPLEAQRQRGMPGTSPALELARAQAWFAAIAGAAPEVVYSHALEVDARQVAVSPVLRHLPRTARPLTSLSVAAPLEIWRDERGRVLPAGTALRGGARVLENYASCSFRGFARHRLAAEAPEEFSRALDGAARGHIVHAALAHIWRELVNQDALCQRSAESVRDLVQQAIETHAADLRRALARRPKYWAIWRQGVECLLLDWLAQERRRTSFEVVATETESQLHLGGLDFNLRLDRLDRLEGGSLLVIDYKTGDCNIGDWNGERPRAPQLPMYALSLTEAPAGLAFFRLKRGRMNAVALSDATIDDPWLVSGRNARSPDFVAQRQEWHHVLAHLAERLRQGEAPVDPLNAGVCRSCDLASLCRIQLSDAESEADADA